MKWLKTFKIFEADGSFFYNPDWETSLPKVITLYKGDKDNPEISEYKIGITRHLGLAIQIPYETTNTNGGRENPDTLEFDIGYDYDTNSHSLSINVEVNYGDLTACQFSIESPNKFKEIVYTSLHSKDDTSNTIFGIDDESLKAFCEYINKWDHGIFITPSDLKLLDRYDDYIPSS